VVPLLQERGVFRTEYTTTTLRDHLGLPAARPATAWAAAAAAAAGERPAARAEAVAAS